MSKKVRNILIIVFVIIVILLSGIVCYKMDIFNLKSASSNKPKQSEKTSSLVNDEEEINEDDMLPSDDDVETVSPTETEGETTTTANNQSSNNSSSKKTTNKKTTTKKVDEGANNSGRPSVSTAKFDSDINSVKLNPMKTRKTDLDNKIGNIINSITNSSMTNNQKLYAVFRYIIDHSEYGNGIIYDEEIRALVNKYHYKRYDATLVHEAEKILNSGVGVCDDYSALFTIMARRIGFDAYVVGGSVKTASGGTTGHAWVNILANGTYYVFDPQIADKRPKQEKFYYGKTDKEITIYSYNDRNWYVKNFNRFREVAPLKLDVSLSGSINDNKSVASYNSNIIKNISYSNYVGDKININIKTSGASKYTYNVKVKPNNGHETSLYAKQNDTNTNLNLSYSFDADQEYRFYITVWSGDNGSIAEYYFTVRARIDDRIKDVNVTTTKEVEHSTSGDYPYYTFNANVIKNSSSSTCTPRISYDVVSSDDSTPRVVYNNRMYYEPGRTYNIKVTVNCGIEKFEKTITVKE